VALSAPHQGPVLSASIFLVSVASATNPKLSVEKKERLGSEQKHECQWQDGVEGQIDWFRHVNIPQVSHKLPLEEFLMTRNSRAKAI
jgi:hypothetical protein